MENLFFVKKVCYKDCQQPAVQLNPYTYEWECHECGSCYGSELVSAYYKPQTFYRAATYCPHKYAQSQLNPIRYQDASSITNDKDLTNKIHDVYKNDNVTWKTLKKLLGNSAHNRTKRIYALPLVLGFTPNQHHVPMWCDHMTMCQKEIHKHNKKFNNLYLLYRVIEWLGSSPTWVPMSLTDSKIQQMDEHWEMIRHILGDVKPYQQPSRCVQKPKAFLSVSSLHSHKPYSHFSSSLR